MILIQLTGRVGEIDSAITYSGKVGGIDLGITESGTSDSSRASRVDFGIA